MKHFFASMLAVIVATLSATLFAAADNARPEAPAAPILLPAADGSTKVGIRALAPARDIDGNPLSSLISIIIYRDGKPITGGQEPCGWYEQQITVGELTDVFTDAEILGLTPGVHTYHFTATNLAGTSAESEHVSVYIGIPRPVAPTEATATATSKPGEVTVSWTAPTVDFEGHVINPESLSYAVYDITDPSRSILVADNINATSHTWQAVTIDTPQQMKRYRVLTVTRAGQSRTGAETAAIAVGRPLTLPYADSFTGTGLYEFRTLQGDAGWSIVKSGTPDAYDADKAVAMFSGNADGDLADMLSCDIEIPANVPDVVMSYYYSGAKEYNPNYLQVLIDDGKGFAAVREHDLSDGRWHRAEIDMSSYAGKTVRFGFRMNFSYWDAPALVDNIRIAQRAATDVAVSGFTVPAITKGQAATISADITNAGTLRAENVSVDLYLDGEIVATEKLSIDAGATAKAIFSLKVPVIAGESAVLRATATLDNDANTADNTSCTVNAPLNNPGVAVVTGLTAEATDNTVTLSWSEPAETSGPRVSGYNVYCDNTLVNTDPVTATAFTHENVAKGTHTYCVTVIYSNGIESAASNTAQVEIAETGIDTAVAGGVTIAAAEGAIIVRAADGTRVEITAMDGRAVCSDAVRGSALTVSVPAGIYAVRAGSAAAKIIVR